ncbi:MAG: ATP-binding protein [Candidatus Muiribacteriota bacterium]
MSITKTFNIEGGNFSEAGLASSEVKKLLKKIGIPANVIKKVAIAMYESEINIVAHAFKGVMEVIISPAEITIKAEDEGPGIPDIDKAMQEGFSTASQKVREMGFGAGMGLPNIKRNTDFFDIKTEVDKGTRLEIKIKFN